MFEAPKQVEKSGFSPTVLAVIAVVALIGGTVGYLLYQRGPAEAPQPTLTEEARSYLPNLALSDDTGMAAKEDALGQTLLEITGAITNNGDRACRSVEVNVVFFDPNGIETDRQRSLIVNPRQGPLQPAETRQFRMAFDNISPAWNQAFPSLFISQIDFAD
ncbi:MAG: hypothetical protein GC160_09505 [Acidobacteria bacterium]|nr:hypothetical protein [Acidobacteriota bacterium]